MGGIVKITTILLLVVFCATLAGCNGSRETDQLAYVLAIGVDQAEGELLEVTYQIALPRTTSSSDSSSDGKKSSTNLTYKSSNLAEARNLLNSTLALRSVLYHAKIIVVGEKLAKKGLGDIMGPLKRYREYRGSMYVAVARGTAKDFLSNSESVAGLSPAKFFEESMTRYSDSNYVMQTTLHQFYGRMKDRTVDPYLALVAVSPDTTALENSKDGNPKDSKGETYIAGAVPRKGGTKVGFLGTALFKAEKMVGILNDKQTRCLSMLLGNFTYSFISVKDPLIENKSVNIYLHQEKRPSVHVVLDDGKPYYNVDISLEGDITGIASGTNYEKEKYQKDLEEEVKQIIADEMQNTIEVMKTLDCDAAGFGYYLRPLFAKQKDLDDFLEQHHFHDSDISVNVKFQVRRAGLMWQTMPIF